MNFLSKNRKRIVIGSILLFVIWWITFPWPFGAARGRFAAHLDLAMGNYQIVRYGLSIPDAEYTVLLKQRYGIRSKRIAYCIVSESEREYADAYNKLAMAAVKRKCGHDVLTECYEEAESNWQKRMVER